MQICTITEYGIFNTEFAFPGQKRSEGRILKDFQIEYFISCNGKAIVDDAVYPLEPGNILCAKPGQSRRSEFGFRCYYIHCTFPEGSPYYEKLMKTPDFYRIADPHIYGRIFEDMIQHLILDGYQPESDLLNAKLLELFYYLDRDGELNRNYLEYSEPKQNPMIPKVLNYLQENLAKPIRLEDMAKETGYSPHYFHGIFTSVMGRTPLQYLLQMRIRKAKDLLIRSDHTLAQIAYECGFSSQSYLNLQVRSQAGITPGQYRKMHFEKYVP